MSGSSQDRSESNVKEETEKYVSCEFLETGMVCFSKGIRHCCSELPVEVNHLEMQEYDNTFDQDIDNFVKKFIDRKQEIINKNRSGRKTMCTRCSYLKEGYWLKERKIISLNFSFDSACNFRCQYCYTVRNQDYKANVGRGAYEVMAKLLASNYIQCEEQII